MICVLYSLPNLLITDCSVVCVRVDVGGFGHAVSTMIPNIGLSYVAGV